MVIEPPTKPRQVPDLRQRDVRETAGNVLLATKTSYASIMAAAFTAGNPDSDALDFINGNTQGTLQSEADNINLFATIQLPHNAIVTAVLVDGSPIGEAVVWEFIRFTISDGTHTIMATANLGATDTSISNATVDNSTYAYMIRIIDVDIDDELFGARITYTTNYD